MRKNTEVVNADESEGEAMPFEEKGNSNIWRGCLFCMTGQENHVAFTIEMRCPGIKARAVSAVKRRSRQGVKSLSIEVIMPGYVFFEANEDVRLLPPYPDGIIRMLTTVDGEWKLIGSDDEFARWLLEHDGMLSLSQAHKVGDRIVVHQGPLKDFEGDIIKIDRRNENGLVQLKIGGNSIRVWLPFEVVDTETK